MKKRMLEKGDHFNMTCWVYLVPSRAAQSAKEVRCFVLGAVNCTPCGSGREDGPTA